MKSLILLCLVVAAQSAAIVYHPAAWFPSSAAYKAEDGVGNYAFGHHDAHPGGPSFHKESGNVLGHKIGSYGVQDPDGKVRIVDYVANHEGFKANIRTSEKLAEDHQDPVGVKTTELKPVPVAYAHPFPVLGHHYYVAV